MIEAGQAYETVYFANGGKWVISREYGIHPLSKIPMHGMWVLRNMRTGEYLDSDMYFNDLTERNNIEVCD